MSSVTETLLLELIAEVRLLRQEAAAARRPVISRKDRKVLEPALRLIAATPRMDNFTSAEAMALPKVRAIAGRSVKAFGSLLSRGEGLVVDGRRLVLYGEERGSLVWALEVCDLGGSLRLLNSPELSKPA
jgi:hypothetical protein